MHCSYSFDSEAKISDQLLAARRMGLTEICFTDHVDFDELKKPYPRPLPDLDARRREIESLAKDFPDITVKHGAEISLSDASAAERAEAYLEGRNLDFVIGSVHAVNGVETYYEDYMAGRTKQTAYYDYLDAIYKGIKPCKMMNVLGHYDFVAKFTDYADRRMTLDVSKELFYEIFKLLIERGKGIEVNTSAWKDDPCWGLDVLKLYRELGGEFITTGSDAHIPKNVGRRLDEACALAKEAGIPYIASFDKMKPIFHRL